MAFSASSQNKDVSKRHASAKIAEILDRLQKVHGRPVSRIRFEPMEELISCILSQHTTDVNSFPAFDRLREACPEWCMVVQAGPEKVADWVRQAGLANQKARHIVACLQKIYERSGDYTLEPIRQMPTDEAQAFLESLPGVGPKTATLVLSFSFGRPTIPVDTHILRVGKRLGIFPESASEKQAHTLAREIVPPDRTFDFHALLIQHGRLYCRAPKPKCSDCVLVADCPWEGKP